MTRRYFEGQLISNLKLQGLTAKQLSCKATGALLEDTVE